MPRMNCARRSQRSAYRRKTLIPSRCQRSRARAAALKQGMHRTKPLLEQLLTLARHEAIPSGHTEMPLAALDRVAKEVVAYLLPDATARGIDLGFAPVEPLTVRGEPVMLAAIIRN